MNISCTVIDDELLPFAPASVDLIVSSLVLQTVNDLLGTLIQARRALTPDGLFIATLLGGQSLSELRLSLVLAEEACEGGASPRVLPFADVRDLGALMQRAGFTLPVADTETITLTYPAPVALMAELKHLGAANPLSDRRSNMTRFIKTPHGHPGRIPSVFIILHF